MNKYIPRNIAIKINEMLGIFPAVAILGPRQSGKTTLAKAIGEISPKESVYLDLEDRTDIVKLDDPYIFFESCKNKLVILDEVQRKPEIFKDLRSIIDSYNIPGRFIILGSCSPELLKQSSESLAGRIGFTELTPFSITEVNESENLWFRGGFPKSYLASNDKASRIWIENFIKTFLNRDIPSLGIRIPPLQIEQFWEMLSHLQGQIWNASLLGKNFGLSSPTIKSYLSILESTYMLRQLYPYSVNIKKRIVKTPKVYIRDSGILHCLLRIVSIEQLFGHPCIGASYEGWIIEQICNNLNNSIKPYFYRTHAGAEIDLILDTPEGLIGIEIKRSSMPSPRRGFHEAVNDLNIKSKFILYPGNNSFTIKDGIKVMPPYMFINEEMKNRKLI